MAPTAGVSVPWVAAAAWRVADCASRKGRKDPTCSSTTCRKSLATRTSVKPFRPSATSYQPKSLSTSRPICQSVSVFPFNLTWHYSNRNFELYFSYFRFRVVRQPDELPGGHPSHERLSDRHQTAQSPAETFQRRLETLLKRNRQKLNSRGEK